MSEKGEHQAWSVANKITWKIKDDCCNVDAPWGYNRVTLFIFDGSIKHRIPKGFHFRLAHKDKDFEKVRKRALTYAKKIGVLIERK